MCIDDSALPVLVSFTEKDSFPLTQTATTDSTLSWTLHMLVFMLLKMQGQVDCTSGACYIELCSYTLVYIGLPYKLHFIFI